MDALRLVRGPSPFPISAGAGVRHHPPAAQVSAVGPRGGVALEEEADEGEVRKKGNWVMNILRVRSIWEKERERAVVEREDAGWDLGGDSCVGCDECSVGEERGEGEVKEEAEEKVVFDRESFSRLLTRVSLIELQVYAKASYLGNLAYSIPKIKV